MSGRKIDLQCVAKIIELLFQVTKTIKDRLFLKDYPSMFSSSCTVVACTQNECSLTQSRWAKVLSIFPWIVTAVLIFLLYTLS